MTSLAVVRAALQSLQRSPSRCFPLRGFGVLADDVHIHAITSELHIFIPCLVESCEFLSYPLKDSHVGVGSSSSFRWLGYTIVGGHCYLEEQKLLAILSVPERYVKDN